MFIHPWDAGIDAAEWQEWLAGNDRFGILGVNNLDPTQAPIMVPTHFTLSGDHLLIHLARPNPVWPHLEAAVEVRLAIYGDYAYIPGYWRAADDVPAHEGVPTSYYAAVQFRCHPTILDDPQDKADLIVEQLADFQPEGDHAAVTVGEAPYGRMLPGIRGLRLEILDIEAKFKYDDHKPVALRERTIDHLGRRARPLDASAARQQQRRLDALGPWSPTRPE